MQFASSVTPVIAADIKNAVCTPVGAVENVIKISDKRAKTESIVVRTVLSAVDVALFLWHVVDRAVCDTHIGGNPLTFLGGGG